MVKISDVAKLAAVSDATVSRILSGDASFSASLETRQKVLNAASQLGYRTNRQRKGKPMDDIGTLHVGLLMTSSQEDETNDPYFQSIRLGIEKQCAAMDLILIKTIRLSPSLSPADFVSLDGLIVVGAIDPQSLRQIQVANQNMVLINNLDIHDPDCDVVLADLTYSTENCLDLLYQLGHRSIGYMGGSEIIHDVVTHQNAFTRDIRHRAFENKMNQLGFFNPEHVYIGNWSALDGQRMAREAIRKGSLPTAFIIASDPISMGVIHAFREAGIRVPEDVSIISFDDIETAGFTNPPLTTVRIFTEEIGRQAVNLLVDRMKGREIVVNVVVPSKLTIRQSHASPRQDA